MAYYTHTAIDTKLSNFSSSITYSQYKQTIFPFHVALSLSSADIYENLLQHKD